MTLKDFLDRIIDDGIAASSKSYKNDPQKREGSAAGFNACRGKTVFELRQQLDISRKTAEIGLVADRKNYWYLRCFHAEVEWVCNVVSAALRNQGEETIVTPTARGFLKAAEILGVRANMSLKEFRDSQEN